MDASRDHALTTCGVSRLRVLVACEFSGTVRDAFRRRGHDAWSCDLLPTDADPEFHLQGNALAMASGAFGSWDLMIAHPPCTYLSLAGNKYFGETYRDRFPTRRQDREDALDFVRELMDAPVPMIAVENPISVISTRIRKPDQIIQPFQYGHPDRKPTCLWLKGLPKLRPGEIVAPNIVTNRNGKTASAHHDAALALPPSERWKARSKTYLGIAEAMAEQWGGVASECHVCRGDCARADVQPLDCPLLTAEAA